MHSVRISESTTLLLFLPPLTLSISNLFTPGNYACSSQDVMAICRRTV